MGDILDFNARTVIEGISSIEQCGEELLELLIEVASGRIQTKAMGQDDFIPWRRDISL